MFTGSSTQTVLGLIVILPLYDDYTVLYSKIDFIQDFLEELLNQWSYSKVFYIFRKQGQRARFVSKQNISNFHFFGCNGPFIGDDFKIEHVLSDDNNPFQPPS